ncbi:hypothetical protein SELMODRAFT_410570 [Selaginella moellendorffii]|uniref:Uncharacterized protein n=1 Tax=Selaginella moellendorffii TaxID=88036 RepID=D8RF60_SELML|nr:hypothetical protein SELMODRAFT_410570 [Selaginella moellendorffii]
MYNSSVHGKHSDYVVSEILPLANPTRRSTPQPGILKFVGTLAHYDGPQAPLKRTTINDAIDVNRLPHSMMKYGVRHPDYQTLIQGGVSTNGNIHLSKSAFQAWRNKNNTNPGTNLYTKDWGLASNQSHLVNDHLLAVKVAVDHFFVVVLEDDSTITPPFELTSANELADTSKRGLHDIYMDDIVIPVTVVLKNRYGPNV